MTFSEKNIRMLLFYVAVVNRDTSLLEIVSEAKDLFGLKLSLLYLLLLPLWWDDF